MSNGDTAAAAYVSLLFALVVVAIYGIVFIRNPMGLARKKYVVEERGFSRHEAHGTRDQADGITESCEGVRMQRLMSSFSRSSSLS
jgi:hypothetical protein